MPIHLGDDPRRIVFLKNTSSQQRTLIRKTSLLHKIDPTALRSSFADTSIVRDLRRSKCSGIARLG